MKPIPIPVPAKYLYPYVGSWVLKGWGQGQPKMTPGLPVLITNNFQAVPDSLIRFNIACLLSLSMLLQGCT